MYKEKATRIQNLSDRAERLYSEQPVKFHLMFVVGALALILILYVIAKGAAGLIVQNIPNVQQITDVEEKEYSDVTITVYANGEAINSISGVYKVEYTDNTMIITDSNQKSTTIFLGTGMYSMVTEHTLS